MSSDLMLSKRAQLLKPSPTLALAAKAKELAAQGHHVVSLTVGEPDWTTYSEACDAAIAAVGAGFTKYTLTQGIPELRQEIVKNLKEEIGITYTPNEVMVSVGAKYVLFCAFQMLLSEGDEVLIPAPYWVSYPTMVELAGATSVFVESSEKTAFKVTAEDLEKKVTAKTKMLILCSPSNPTGMLYTRDELAQIAAFLKKHPQIFLISDDIYNRLVFDGELAPHILQVAPELRNQVLCVNGVSKTFAMTGWRVGWAAGPEKLIKVMTDFASQSTSNTCGISQKAALAALQKCQPHVRESVELLRRRRALCIDEIAKIPNVSLTVPQGAFYLWLNVSKLPIPSKDFAAKLLAEKFVATVPGDEFGMAGYVRLSYATSDRDLVEAFARIRTFCQDLLK